MGDPDTTYWGGVRASMGRREPFSIPYVAIGNENCYDYVNYSQNYPIMYNAIKQLVRPAAWNALPLL